MQATPMVQVSRPADFPPVATPTPMRVLSIPLEDGKTLDVRFPADLSKQDFDFVVENIKLWERTIVAKTRQSAPSPPTTGMRSLEFAPDASE